MPKMWGRHARPVRTRRRTVIFKNGILAAGGGSTAYVPVPLEWRGTTKQVFSEPQHPYTWGLLTSVTGLDHPRRDRLAGLRQYQ